MGIVFHVNLEKLEDGRYQVTYQSDKDGGSQPFDTWEEAASFVNGLTIRLDQLEKEIDMAQDEKAASQTTPEEAEEINSDVRQHGDVADPTEKQPSELKDTGAGNREAPHQTKTTANDPKNEKGRAN